MGLKRYVRKVVDAQLRSFGYQLVKSDYAPLGSDAMLDIKRMALAWGYPAKIFFDVGANLGQTTGGIFKRFPGARVFAFEPHPGTFQLLKQNVGNCEGFEAYNLAFGAGVGQAELLEYEMSAVNSLMPDARFAVRFGKKETRRIQVNTTTIDQFCSEHQLERVDVLKIDTEGYDLFVLQGAEELISRQKVKFILTEFNDIHPRAGMTGGSLANVDGFLHRHGYRFVCSYPEWMAVDGEFFSVSNALFILPPSRDPKPTPESADQ